MSYATNPGSSVGGDLNEEFSNQVEFFSNVMKFICRGAYSACLSEEKLLKDIFPLRTVLIYRRKVTVNI